MSLFQLAAKFFTFPAWGADSELVKLIWLVRLRWMAISLFFILAPPAYYFGFLNASTLFIYLCLVTFLMVINGLTHVYFIMPRKKIGPLHICFQLATDLIALFCMLILAGGFSNPFTVLFLLNTSLGGVLISRRLGWPFLLLTHTLLGSLQLYDLQTQAIAWQSTTAAYIFVSHVLVILFWLVMSSLGSYLQRQSEAQAQARFLLERQDRLRALGSLAAGFSHEFASPLNAAKLRLERHCRTQTPSAMSEDLTEALGAIRTCEQVIQQMNSSQLDARDFHLKSVRIKDLLQDIVESWREENPATAVIIENEIEDLVKIPPINFAQVVLNLLDNAHESAPGREIRVRFDRHNETFRFSVQDLGAGFSDSVLQKIGEPFLTTKPSGTGLGLYVSQLFSQSLGGGMRLENIKDAGARVTLTWPVSVTESVVTV